MPQVLEPAPDLVQPGQHIASRTARPWPFLVAASVYVVATALILAVSWKMCGERFVYPLDDVYINMAVAKNFALHGVWGVSPFEFNSTTSSPLFVLLLSGVYRVFGVNVFTPAVLSWGFGMAALSVAFSLVRQHLRPVWQAAWLVGFVVLTPMFLLGTLGMEHALHIVAVLLFLKVFDAPDRGNWQVAGATVLMCAARYEGLLMAGVAVVVLLVERRWLRSAVIAGCAWLPVGIYAWFSISHGGPWLPNSVLLKGVDVASHTLLGRFGILGRATLYNVEAAPHAAFLSVAMLLLAVPLWGRKRHLGALLTVTGGAGVLHLMVAAVGWAFRYEAYLVAAGIVVLACAWPEIQRLRGAVPVAAIGLLSLGFAFLLLRAALCGVLLPQYSRAIYEQQGQMARFLKTYYAGTSIAANDIGFINYETDLHCLDLAGLASAEVFNAKRSGRDTTEFLEQTARAHHVALVVIYQTWFSSQSHIKFGGPELPESWDHIGEWSVPERLQLGDRTVTFFGTDAGSDDLLRQRLKEFQPTLPKRVVVGP